MTFEEVEKTRQTYYNKRSKIIKRIMIVDVCIIIAVVLINLLQNIAQASTDDMPFAAVIALIITSLQVGIFSFVIGIIILTFTTKKELAAYQKSYKAYFVAQGLQKVFTSIVYNHEAGMPRETVGLVMDTGDIYHSNDFTSGCYKKINFSQADVHIEEEHTDSDGDTTYITTFYGRFLVFDFDRNFTSNLQVASKHFYNGTTSNLSKNGHKFAKIKTESIDFNKNFKIYAQDNVDALYILDPAFMEKVQKLYTDCKHEILLTFVDKKVYIAIYDRKDSFEPPMQKTPLNEVAETTKIENDIRVITNFVDSLNLDRYFKGTKS